MMTAPSAMLTMAAVLPQSISKGRSPGRNCIMPEWSPSCIFHRRHISTDTMENCKLLAATTGDVGSL